ncbi:MAG: hypothetical protein ACR2OH_03770 [Microthrixaceae bacterium]
MQVDKLTMVYDADKGLKGEVSYLFGLMKGKHCALCDITHSGIRRKSDFEQLTCSLPVPVEVIYRNQQDPALAEFTGAQGAGAVVVASTEAGLRVLMDDTALIDCSGDVDTFAAELASRLSELQAAPLSAEVK